MDQSAGLVAKHRAAGLDEAYAELDAACAAQACGVCVAPPLGIEAATHGTLSWWTYVGITGPASPTQAAQFIRILHDRVPTHTIRAKPTALTMGTASTELVARIAPWVERAQQSLEPLVDAPVVFGHGDANPTNLVRVGTSTLGLDWGSSGLAPRVSDLATVMVLAVETSLATPDEVQAAYGSHPDIRDEWLNLAVLRTQVARLVSCTKNSGWTQEGFDRLAALESGTGYRFGPGEGPK